jgi:GNAT superfamily N-acetyltransferase
MDYRTAEPCDAPLLARLNQQLIVDEGHRNRMTLPELEQRMGGWLDGGVYQAVIFQRDGETVGYALFRSKPEHVYVRQFFVCRAVRRQGIGREAVAWLRRHAWVDASRIRVDVLAGNEQGIEFWRSVGFRDYCITMEMDGGDGRVG